MADVLVVDDDPGIRHILRVVLDDAGYMVYAVGDGHAALQFLWTSPKASKGMVVILDYWMPFLDGQEVLHAIAADPMLARLHAVILVSANRDYLPRAFVELLTNLHIPIVTKPFDIDDLLTVVADAAACLDE